MAFLKLETAYYVVLVALIILGYRYWGLLGTGVAITLAHGFDMVMIQVYAHKKYGYRMSAAVSRYAFVLFLLGAFAYAATIVLAGIVYWVVELMLVLASAIYALQNLKSSSTSTKL